MAQYYAIRTRATRPEMLSEGLNAEEHASFERHSAWLKQRLSDGLMVFVGRTLNTDTTGWALGIVKAETDLAAREIMTDDPFVRDGVVEAELFPFNIIAMEPNNL
jgi:uncharacterized protein YciI